MISNWWFDARLRWRTLHKGPLIVFSLLGLAVTSFGGLVYSVLANEAERQSLFCLALNVYFEARGESQDGQYAVAEVTMNRVASSRYPDTVCGVVYQKNLDTLRKRHVGAFSWTELSERSEPKGEEWRRAVKVAESVYFERHEPKLKGALFYHSIYIKPSWSRGKKPLARIGKHVFYR